MTSLRSCGSQIKGNTNGWGKPSKYFGSLGIGGEVPRFWGVSGVYTPLTPQNLALTTANPKEPIFYKIVRSLNG